MFCHFLQAIPFSMLESVIIICQFIMVTQIAKFMGPTWGPSGADRTQMGPMLAPWTLLSGEGLVCVLPYKPIEMAEIVMSL